MINEPTVPKWVICKACNGTMILSAKLKIQSKVIKFTWKCKNCKALLRRTYFKSDG